MQHMLGVKVDNENYYNYEKLSIVDNNYSDRVTNGLFVIFGNLYGFEGVSEAFKKLSDGLLIKFPKEGIDVAIVNTYTAKFVHAKLYAVRSFTTLHMLHSKAVEAELISQPFYKIRYYLKPDAYINDKLPENKEKRFCWGELSPDELDEMRYPYEEEN